MGSKARAQAGNVPGNEKQTNKQTAAEQIRDNFLQFTSGRPNIMSDSMVFQRPDGKLEGVNVNFDPFMSELLAGARSGKNVGPPSQTMPPVMFEAPPSQTMPPVFRPPQAPPSQLFKDSVLNTLETVQLPPSVRDKEIPLPGIDVRRLPDKRAFPQEELPAVPIPVPVPTMPGPFLPPPRPGRFDIPFFAPSANPPQSNRNLLPFVVPLPLGIGSLFREFLEGLQEDD